jgi:hypothetical protein
MTTFIRNALVTAALVLIVLAMAGWTETGA